jgi:hypothetical protein
MSVENETIDELENESLDTEQDDDLEVIVDDSDEGEEEAPAEEAAADEPAAEEEAPAAEEDQGVSEDDAELAAMPEKIKKRFQREKRLRDTIIQERDSIRQAALQVVHTIQQKDSELQAERASKIALQKQYADTLEFAFEQAVTLQSGALRKAREDGDYDAELKAQSELDKLRFQQNQVRESKRHIPNAPAPVQQQAAPQPQQQEAPRKPPAPLAVKWVATNKTWFQNPKFKAHHNFVLSVDSDLVTEGYDPQSPEYYKELDRRIDANFPNLRKKAKSTGSPVAPAGNSPSSNRSSKSITLTKVDLGNMRRFGLDPANKDHLREYARSKRASA